MSKESELFMEIHGMLGEPGLSPAARQTHCDWLATLAGVIDRASPTSRQRYVFAPGLDRDGHPLPIAQPQPSAVESALSDRIVKLCDRLESLTALTSQPTAASVPPYLSFVTHQGRHYSDGTVTPW